MYYGTYIIEIKGRKKMENLARTVIALITSMMIGIGILTPQDKVFTPNQYYKGDNSADPIDYRTKYERYLGSVIDESKRSNKSPQSLSGDERTYTPDTVSGFKWFWALPIGDIRMEGANWNIYINYKDKAVPESLADNLARYIKDQEDNSNSYEGLLNESEFTFQVPTNYKLISPGRSYLDPSSVNSEGIYPLNATTKGKYITFIIRKDVYAYKVTYSDMLMWWSDMSKPASQADEYKDGDKDQPVYNHSVTFSEKDKFESGAIVGKAGNSGIPKELKKDSPTPPYLRKDSPAFVTVAIQRAKIVGDGVDDVWEPITFGQFYTAKE